MGFKKGFIIKKKTGIVMIRIYINTCQHEIKKNTCFGFHVEQYFPLLYEIHKIIYR